MVGVPARLQHACAPIGGAGDLASYVAHTPRPIPKGERMRAGVGVCMHTTVCTPVRATSSVQ